MNTGSPVTEFALETEPTVVDPSVVLTEFEATVEIIVQGRISGATVGPDRRLELAQTLATASESNPMAAAQFIGPLVGALRRIHTGARSKESVSSGHRRRIERAFVRSLDAVASDVPSSFYGHCDPIEALLDEGDPMIRSAMGSILSNLVRESPEVVGDPESVLDNCLFDQDIRLNENGCVLLIRLLDSQRDYAIDHIDRLIELCASRDDDLRHAAIDLIHEISLFAPEEVLHYVNTIAALLDDSDRSNQALATMIFVELVGADPEAVCTHAPALVRRVERTGESHGVDVFFSRVAIAAPALLETYSDLVLRVFDADGTLDGPSLALQRLAVDDPNCVADVLEELIVRAHRAEDAESQTEYLRVAYWVIDRGGVLPEPDAIVPARQLLSQTEPAVQALAAAVLDVIGTTASDRSASELLDRLRVDWSQELTGTQYEQLDLPEGPSWSTVVQAVRDRAESESGTVSIEPPNWSDIPEPTYHLNRQPEYHRVANRVRSTLSQQEAVAPSELDRLVGFLDTSSKLVHRSVMQLLHTVSEEQPEDVARLLPEVTAQLSSADVKTRRVASSILLSLASHTPNAIAAERKALLETLTSGDHTVKTRIGLTFQYLPLRVLSPPETATELLLEATDPSYPRMTFALEVNLLDLAQSHPEAVCAHLPLVLEQAKIDLDRSSQPGTKDLPTGRSRPTGIGEENGEGEVDAVGEVAFSEGRVISALLYSLGLANPGSVAKEDSRIRSLLESTSSTVRRRGVIVLTAVAMTGHPGAGKFCPDVVALLRSDPDPSVRTEAADCLNTVSQIAPRVVADHGDVLTRVIRDQSPSTTEERSYSEMTTTVLEIIDRVFDDLQETDAPTPEDVLPYLDTDEAGMYASNILAQLVKRHPDRAYRHRDAVVRWCRQDRSPSTLVGAVDFLAYVGSTADLTLEVSAVDE